MNYDVNAVQEELKTVDRLIAEKCLQRMRLDRAANLAEKGLTGFACADGLYHQTTADCCSSIHWVQHLLQLNGTGFLLGLDSDQFEGEKSEYLRCAQFALIYDLKVAYHKLKKGSSVIVLSHAPNCGQRVDFGISLAEMMLATHRAHDRVVAELGIDHNVVIPALMVDRTYGTFGPGPKEVELYVIKHELVRHYAA
ncbi:MAG: hypothetical protein WC544_03245 [Patescibacteria group bacterium]